MFLMEMVWDTVPLAVMWGSGEHLAHQGKIWGQFEH